MAGRKAAQEHGARARARAGESTEEELEENGGTPREPTQAEKDRDAALQRERDVMSGGPGDDERQEPEWQTFSYGGKEFKTQEDLTAYIDELQEQRRQQPAPQRQEPQQQRQETKPPAGDGEIDWDKELYTDPKSAMTRFGDHIRKQVRQEMTAEYRAEQTMNKFWENFYSANPDMKGKELIVKAVFDRDLPKIGELPIPDALTALGKSVTAEVQKLGGKPRPSGQETSERNRTLVESGSGAAQRRGGGDRQSQAEKDPPSSLSAIIRQRQIARSQHRTASS